MSFLVPAFLAGLAALAIPVLVHLTRRQRSRVQPFPSLLFLHKVPHEVTQRRRIQHWALLALRALAVILLVAAFARPFFTDDDGAATVGSGPTERVVLLDRSYSMAAGGRWDAASAAVLSEMAGVGPLDRVSLVLFGQGASVAVRSSSDPRALAAALDTLGPGWEATRYGPGLKLAQAILDESELPGRELVMVGDFQRGGWSGDDDVRLPAGTRVRTVAVGGDAGANAAVAAVELARETVAGRERVTPAARIVRTGGSDGEERRVTLEVDGRVLQERTVTLPASGAATVSFAPFTVADRYTRGSVRLDADALPRDDARHFVLSPGRALRVLLLTRSGAARETALYLERALRISSAGAFDVTVRTWSAAATTGLEDVGVVVLADVPLAGGAAAERLGTFVRAGGGLVVVAGASAGWPSDDDLFPGRLGGVSDRMEGGGGRLGQMEYDHPVFEPFRGPRSGDFSTARFFRHRTLQGASAGEVLARFDDGAPALAERRVGEGKVLVWTSTLDALWNDLPLQPVFLPFAHALVRHASGRRETLPWLVAGQVVDVSDGRAMASAGLVDVADARLMADEARVALTPGGRTLDLPAGAGPHYLRLDEGGFYQLRAPGEAPTRPLTVAVNVDLAESDLAAMDPEEIGAVLRAGAGSGEGSARVRQDDGRAGELVRADRERRQSLWRFLLVGALAALALETVLSNRVSPAVART